MKLDVEVFSKYSQTRYIYFLFLWKETWNKVADLLLQVCLVMEYAEGGSLYNGK